MAGGLVPVFYQVDVATAINIAEATIAGGVTAIEFTNRAPFAHAVFAEMRQYVAEKYPQVVVGAGTILDAPTAALYIANGADFIVSPSLIPEIATLCNTRKVPYLPGCGTLTEITKAESLGVEIIKLFPGIHYSPDFVKATLAPMPRTRIMPTGGVTAEEENIKAWFEAGVTCVGMGSKLTVKSDVADGNWSAITERTQQVMKWIQQYKKEQA